MDRKSVLFLLMDSTMRLFRRKAIDYPQPKTVRCSFCGKSKDAVAKMISGPNVYICNECIELANKILAEETSKRPQHTP